MAKTSFGLLVFKVESGRTLVLLAHPGGPLWENKDFWTLPKGESEAGEDELSSAKREFSEETGLVPPDGELIDLGLVAQSSVKINHIWAVSGDADLAGFSSNSFSLEWPPNSGQLQQFPEIDRIAWFDLNEARAKLFPKQKEFIDRLEQALKS